MADSQRPQRTLKPSQKARDAGFAVSPTSQQSARAGRSAEGAEHQTFVQRVQQAQQQQQQQGVDLTDELGDERTSGVPATAKADPAATKMAAETGDDVVEVPPKKMNWPPKETSKWSNGARTALVTLALKHQIWAQRASGDRLRDRVAAFNAACRSGVYAAIFEGKTDDQIKCAYNDLLKRKRKSNDVDVNRASGTSPDPLEDEAAKLDKVTGDVVDAVAAAALEMKKEKEQTDEHEAATRARVNAARDNGMKNCRPNSHTTPFGQPIFRAGRGGGSRPGGSTTSDVSIVDSTGGSNSSVRSSPLTIGGFADENDEEDGPSLYRIAFKLDLLGCQLTRCVEPMGDDVMEVLQDEKRDLPPEEDFLDELDVSKEEFKNFFEDGWVGEELAPATAVMLMMISIYRISNTVPGGKENWAGRVSKGKPMEWQDVRFPGVKMTILDALCKNYTADIAHLKAATTGSAFKLYTSGWKGDQLSSDVVDYLHSTLALLLLTGKDFVPSAETDGLCGHRGRKGKGKRATSTVPDKGGRKTREPKFKITEDSLTSQIQEEAARSLAAQASLREEERDWRKAQADAEQRRYERSEQQRKEDMAEAARIRDEKRQEDKEIREHQFQMMLLAMGRQLPVHGQQPGQQVGHQLGQLPQQQQPGQQMGQHLGLVSQQQLQQPGQQPPQQPQLQQPPQQQPRIG